MPQLAEILKSDMITVRADRKRRNIKPRIDSWIPARPNSKPSRLTTIRATATKMEILPFEEAEDHDPWRRSQSHRPGHRVRLLLRARQFALREIGFRNRDGQFEPRDVSTDYDTATSLFRTASRLRT